MAAHRERHRHLGDRCGAWQPRAQTDSGVGHVDDVPDLFHSSNRSVRFGHLVRTERK